jgi:hypothetical protein
MSELELQEKPEELLMDEASALEMTGAANEEENKQCVPGIFCGAEISGVSFKGLQSKQKWASSIKLGF